MKGHFLYKKNNSFKARGDVVVKQGDSIELYSENLEYDGNSRKIIAKTNVIFKNNNTTLKTQILFHDRDLKEIYFENGGIIKDSTNTIKSTEGKYFLTNSLGFFNICLIAKKYNIPLVACQNSYYIDKDDKLTQDVIMAL